jgi:surfactin synthase thioesterase subunit
MTVALHVDHHDGAWLLRQPVSSPCQRLFCLPCAGGNAAHYLSWQEQLRPGVELCAVQLPGRGSRLSEPPLRSLPVLVDRLVPVITRHSDLPFAFFGHSLGGMIAFELARHLSHQGLPMPRHLFVAACPAPRRRPPSRRLHELDDSGLLAVLGDYNGTPRAALENRELMELLLPSIRADFSLAANYSYQPAPLLDIPLSVLTGRQDDHVEADRLHHWQEETTNACNLFCFDGDHFFVHAHQHAVVDCLRKEWLQAEHD